MRILCISDIHGYATALEQMLQFGKSQGCTTVLAAGDLCFPGPQPLQCWQMLQSVHAHCVKGLADIALATMKPDQLVATNDHERQRLETLRNAQEALGKANLARIHKLPMRFRMTLEDGGELLLVHGSPADPTTAMTHDMPDDEIGALLGDETESVVVCGGDHVPFDRFVQDCRVVAAGSVGMAPTEGVAHGAILDTSPSGVHVRLIQLVLARSPAD